MLKCYSRILTNSVEQSKNWRFNQINVIQVNDIIISTFRARDSKRKVVGHNVDVSHRHNVYNLFTNNISYIVCVHTKFHMPDCSGSLVPQTTPIFERQATLIKADIFGGTQN
jgi:hypothetical protein